MEYFEEDWEENEFKIGDWVGNPGWDWDLEVLWPCLITKIIDENTVEICEALSYRIDRKHGYSISKTNTIEKWDEKEQLKWYKKLKKDSKHSWGTSKEWLNFIKKHKKYEI